MSKYKKRLPHYMHIKEYILDQLREGVLKPGDRLPSEHELTSQFGVSRITVKQAFALLVEEGLIYRIQGKGSYVSNESKGEPVLYRAQEPRTQPLHLVAFLIPSLDSSYSVNLLKGVEGTLGESGYRLLFCRTGHSQKNEREIIEEAVQSGVKGIIVFPAEGHAYNEAILHLTLNRYPIVVIDRYIKGVETNCVCSDHFSGAFDATTHLLALGHKRIAYLTPPYSDTSSLEERLEGYKAALAHAMLPVENRLIVTDLGEQQLIDYFTQHKDVTGVFATNAEIGLKAIDALEAVGIRVPDQVSVIFFDTYENASYSRIPPTTIVQQEEELGRAAASLLLSLIHHPDRERQKIILPPKLVVGCSTAAPCPSVRS